MATFARRDGPVSGLISQSSSSSPAGLHRLDIAGEDEDARQGDLQPSDNLFVFFAQKYL